MMEISPLQAMTSEKKRYEQQLTQLKEDSQRAFDQALVENKVLQGQLEALENFRYVGLSVKYSVSQHGKMCISMDAHINLTYKHI